MARSNYHVCILTNYHKTVLYTGVMANLEARVIQHYQNRCYSASYTGRYQAFYLVFYESSSYINNCIAREKEIKGWTRKKKEALITAFNPEWKFLNAELLGSWPLPEDHAVA